MRPIELRARRIALGVGQADLAALLGVKQVTVSAWESGTRRIPDGISDDLGEIEFTVQEMVDAAFEVAESQPVEALVVHRSDAGLARAHPELDGSPVELQMVAMARAASLIAEEQGFRPILIEAPPES